MTDDSTPLVDFVLTILDQLPPEKVVERLRHRLTTEEFQELLSRFSQPPGAMSSVLPPSPSHSEAAGSGST